MLKCKNCWWFKENPLKDGSGQCLVYGFSMDRESVVCCDFDRGEEDG